MKAYRSHAHRWPAIALLNVICLVLLVISHPVLPGVALAQGQPLAWHDTGVRLPNLGTSSLCFDATRPDIVLAVGNDHSYAYNWRTARGSLLNTLAFEVCPPDGWLYAFPGAGQLSRFRFDHPSAEPAAHIPNGIGPDGLSYAYEQPRSDPSPILTIWVSGDDGVTWQSHSHQFPAEIESYCLAPADARVVYALIKNETPPQPGMRNYSIYASSDAGLTWERRSTGQTKDGDPGYTNRPRRLVPIAGSSVPVDLVQMFINYGGGPTDPSIVGVAANVELRLSGDGGRSFQSLGSSGESPGFQLMHTHEGILRLENHYSYTGGSQYITSLVSRTLSLSTDHGRTWRPLPLPPQSGPRDYTGVLFVAPAAPANLIFEGGGEDAQSLYSPDGGHTWQQIPYQDVGDYIVSPYLPLSVLGISLIALDDPRRLTPLPGEPTPPPNSTPSSGDPSYPKGSLYALDLPDAGRSLPWPVQPSGAPGSRFFSPTGHNLSGLFQQYWAEHGGLPQQGYPLTEAFREVSDLDGRVYTTQYFERAVYELHPTNQPPYKVLGSLLGVFAYQQRYGSAGAPGQQASTDNPLLFSETNHTIGGKFRAYWESHGGLAQQGYPISDEFTERNQLDGKTYRVQYFQRAVFELHPENTGTPYEVLLSQLGTFRLQAKYGPHN